MSSQNAGSRLPWALVIANCLGMFAVTSGGSARAPFLIDMSQDLGTSLLAIANLFGVTSIAWAIGSFVAGTFSDLIGRRLFLVGGPVALALSLVGIAQSGSYVTLALWAFLAGVASGCFTGVSLAEVSLRVADNQRGRALAWVMGGQSLTLLLGVPIASYIGASIGWRGVNVCIGALALVSALALYATSQPRSTPTRKAGGGDKGLGTSFRALTGSVLGLLGAAVAERVCFALVAIYFATFLQKTYGLSLTAVALPLAIFAAGNILGTLAGGVVGDRWSRRWTFAISMAASGLAALALFYGRELTLPVAVTIAFIYSLLNALSRPSIMALIADVPAEARGTVMGLNSTAASFGWLAAGMLGGWIVDGLGAFSAFAPLIGALAALAAVLALAVTRVPGKLETP